MRLLCISAYYKPAYVYGGPVKSVSTLCEGLAHSGISVTVLTTNAGGSGRALDVPTNQSVNVDGVEVHYFPLDGLTRLFPFYFYAPTLGQQCRKIISEFDVAYFFGTWTYPMAAGAKAALNADIPYIVSPRGSFMTWAMQQKWVKKRLYLELIEKRLINHAAAIHCTSQLEQEQQQLWGFKPPSFVIRNPLDVARFRHLPERGTLRQSLGLSANHTLSLFVGRLHKEKRLDLIIEAFARIVAAMPNAHLLIIGPEGDGSGQIAKKQVQELGISNHVHFTGMMMGTELLQAYTDADMLVLLSHRESFGMVVVEGMAAGVPVLISREVGLARDVAEAGAGCVVSAKLDEIVQAWRQMLIDSELRQIMGIQGKVLVQQQFSSEVVAAQMLGLISDVSASRLRSSS
jgi:glycosyltransferase involved in cell wall biosynthesis